MEDMDQVPLTAVPILLQIIGSPDHAQRDETLAVLCDLVSSCYDSDGDALGAAVREADGLLTLSWLLAETDANVVKQTLFLLANLASDAVDPRAYLTKRTLRQCGCEYRLLPCLDHEDDEVISYACGALQNLCNDPEWSQVLLDQGVVSRLEVRACTAITSPPSRERCPGSVAARSPSLHACLPRRSSSIIRLISSPVTPPELSRI